MKKPFASVRAIFDEHPNASYSISCALALTVGFVLSFTFGNTGPLALAFVLLVVLALIVGWPPPFPFVLLACVVAAIGVALDLKWVESNPVVPVARVPISWSISLLVSCWYAFKLLAKWSSDRR